MKGQKPKEVGPTTLANGAGQGIGDSKREPVFHAHIPVCNLPTGSHAAHFGLVLDTPVN
jgi:hypothetical protein